MNYIRAFSWRPTTTVILVVGFTAVLIYSVVAYIVSNFQPTTTVKVGSGLYHLTVADNEGERVQGLSGVDALSVDGGLLMKFDADDKWGIWMKDMKIPLDIIWLNSDKEVVYIVKNASPDLSTNTIFAPKDPSRYVIELAAGSVEKAGIKTGEIADFDENNNGAWW